MSGRKAIVPWLEAGLLVQAAAGQNADVGRRICVWTLPVLTRLGALDEEAAPLSAREER